MRLFLCKVLGHRYRAVANYGTLKYRCVRCGKYWPA